MSKKNKKSGLTSQGVRDLSHLKAPRVAIILEPPPGMMNDDCLHPDEYLIVSGNGAVKCNGCKRIVQ